MLKDKSPENIDRLKKKHKKLYRAVNSDVALFVGCLTPKGEINGLGSQQLAFRKK